MGTENQKPKTRSRRLPHGGMVQVILDLLTSRSSQPAATGRDSWYQRLSILGVARSGSRSSFTAFPLRRPGFRACFFLSSNDSRHRHRVINVRRSPAGVRLGGVGGGRLVASQLFDTRRLWFSSIQFVARVVPAL